MAVDRETVIRVARLARIQVPDGDLDTLAGELSNIIGWVEQLDEVDTDGAEPMTSVVEMVQRLRVDAVTDGHVQDRVLANAPAEADGFFVVPKVIE